MATRVEECVATESEESEEICTANVLLEERADGVVSKKEVIRKKAKPMKCD